jgi:hypothetical protein
VFNYGTSDVDFPAHDIGISCSRTILRRRAPSLTATILLLACQTLRCYCPLWSVVLRSRCVVPAAFGASFTTLLPPIRQLSPSPPPPRLLSAYPHQAAPSTTNRPRSRSDNQWMVIAVLHLEQWAHKASFSSRKGRR